MPKLRQFSQIWKLPDRNHQTLFLSVEKTRQFKKKYFIAFAKEELYAPFWF